VVTPHGLVARPGNVGIGTTTTGFSIKGNGNVAGNVNWICTNAGDPGMAMVESSS
jgi:hypothetical protein